MPIDPNVKFLGITNQNIDLTERRSSKSNGYTDYFSLAEILAEVPVPTVPTLLSELTNDVGFITDNFYTSDDSLTANRTVIGGGFSLKFTGQSNFSIVSPSASALDTAFSVRNNTDTDYLFKVLGDGTTYMRVGQDLYLQGGGNIIMRWETNGAVRCRDYSNAFGERVFESNDFKWRNNSNLLLESLDVNGRRIQKALNSATSDGSLSANDMSFYIDESTNTLKVKVKYSDGTTIKIGTVNLV